MRVVVYVAIFIVLFAGLEFLCGNNEFWDDSFIAMLYARNLARGAGPFFLTLPDQPVSSYARVEGFSNPLWVLLIAAFYWLPGSVFFWIKLASYLSALVLGLVAVKLLREIVPDAWGRTPQWVSFLAAVLVVLNPSVFVYTKSGMETVTFTALVLTGVWHTLKTDRDPRPRNLLLNGMLWFAVALTRPEGILYGAVVGLFLLVSLSRRELRRTLLNWVLPFLLLFTGFLLLRHSLYGEWLPNTFYAKVAVRANGDVRQWGTILKSGVLYAFDFVHNGIGFIDLVLGVASFLWFKSLSGRAMSLIGLVIAANLIFVVAVGGDFWPLYRFFQVTWCLMALLSVVPVLMIAIREPLPGLATKRPIRLSAICAPILGVVLVVAHPFTALVLNSRFYGDAPILSAERLRETVGARHITPLFLLGKWINENLPPDAVVAVDQAGQMPYYADREVVDVLGLNDHYLARHPLDLPYVRRRGVSHWVAAVVDPDTKPDLLYPALLQQPDFRDRFCATRVFEGFNQDHSHFVLVLFTRRDRLNNEELQLWPETDDCPALNLAQMLTRSLPRTVLLSNIVKDVEP